MFTGIIESMGEIKGVSSEGKNIHFQVSSEIAAELKVDQSVAHNGVCLTVTAVDTSKGTYSVTAVDETLQKTNLGNWAMGTKVNLERCLLNNGRFDGHIVQGHVDVTGTCTSIKDSEGSWLFDFEYDPRKGHTMVEKGSITLNGISLTCFEVKDNSFRIAVIPYTYEHTNLHALKVGDKVNLEFDIIGKYVARLLQKGA